jgi:chromate transporter
MMMIMIICGIASAIKKDNDYLLDNSLIRADLKGFKIVGIIAMIAFIIIYAILIVGRIFSDSYYFIISESFYRIGSFAFAGGYSMIPLCLSEFNSLIEKYEFMHGYAIMSLMPGPILNIAGYMGTLLYGLLAGFLSLICTILPGVLIILALLPYYEIFRTKTIYQHFLRGASSAFIGFIFSAAFKLWIDSTITNPYANVPLGTLNIIICFFLLESFNLYVPIVLLASAIFSAFFALLHTNFIK